MMPFDKETGHAIATLMARLRAEWDTPGCLAAVAKVAHLEPSNVAMAAIRLCATPEAETPMALANRDGQHWRERVTSNVVRFPPRRDQACPKHPGEWPTNCRGCAGDRLTGTTSDASSQRRSAAASDRVGELRHLHHIATSGFCSHGVDPARCNEPHPTGDETDREEQR